MVHIYNGILLSHKNEQNFVPFAETWIYLETVIQSEVSQKEKNVQAGFRKGRGTRDQMARDQMANIHWIIQKAREFQKNIYFCFIDYTEAFSCEDHNKLWKILQDIGIQDHLTCLLKNLYAGQEATVNQTWKIKLVQNWERVTSRLYLVTLLIYMQSTSCKMPGWMKHKLE